MSLFSWLFASKTLKQRKLWPWLVLLFLSLTLNYFLLSHQRPTKIILQDKGSGSLAGHTTLPLDRYTQKTGEGPSRASYGFEAGDSFSVPVTGQLKTRLTNAKTGQFLGDVTHDLTGTTTVTFDNTGATAETLFNSVAEYPVNIPEARFKYFDMGIYASNEGFGKFFQVNLKAPLNSQAYIRIDDNNDTTYQAGIHFPF